jgi:hypothetical protein
MLGLRSDADVAVSHVERVEDAFPKPRISTCSCFSGTAGGSATSGGVTRHLSVHVDAGHVGPHRRDEEKRDRHHQRSIIGIMLISESSDPRCPPPSPATSTPAIGVLPSEG